MTARHERPALDLMADYWHHARARGDKPRPVLGLVALSGAGHPAGHVLTWGLLRSYVEQVQNRQQDPDKWEIRTFDAEPAGP